MMIHSVFAMYLFVYGVEFGPVFVGEYPTKESCLSSAENISQTTNAFDLGKLKYTALCIEKEIVYDH
jgi:hypothetical protein